MVGNETTILWRPNSGSIHSFIILNVSITKSVLLQFQCLIKDWICGKSFVSGDSFTKKELRLIVSHEQFSILKINFSRKVFVFVKHTPGGLSRSFLIFGVNNVHLMETYCFWFWGHMVWDRCQNNSCNYL